MTQGEILIGNITVGYSSKKEDGEYKLPLEHQMQVTADSGFTDTCWLTIKSPMAEPFEQENILTHIDICFEYGRPLVRVWTANDINMDPAIELDLLTGESGPAGYFHEKEKMEETA